MINTIKKLKDNHAHFDVLWNKIGTEVQKELVKTAPELLTALGAWYNRSNDLIYELEEQIEQYSTEAVQMNVIDDEDELVDLEDEDFTNER
jgi:uncharacterized protein YdcH (DUF465 family)